LRRVQIFLLTFLLTYFIRADDGDRKQTAFIWKSMIVDAVVDEAAVA